MSQTKALFLPLLLVVVAGAHCRSVESLGCLGSSDAMCVPPSPCLAISYSCGAGFATVRKMARKEDRPLGMRALAANGDWILENDQITAVIDAIEHPNHLATTGGNLLDLAPRGGEDPLNQHYVATGILPRDAVHYTQIDDVSQGPIKAIVARGYLEGEHRITVTTRYEIRPCEPGLRIRTEVFNGSRDPWAHFLTDAIFWGDRGVTPFVPIQGVGYKQPPLDLAVLDDSWRRFPWMAASSHLPKGAAVAELSCTRTNLEGVNDTTISAVGLPRTIVRPGDGIAFERFVIVAPGPGLSGATSHAIAAHGQLFGERTIQVRGRTVDELGGPVGGNERLVSLAIDEGDLNTPEAERTPWTEVVPAADGTFLITLPAGRRYRIQRHQLGRPVAEAITFDGNNNIVLKDLVIAGAPQLVVNVSDATTGAPMIAELVMVPADESTTSSSAGSLHGVFEGCAPFLGSPHGASPACNRVLVRDGKANFAVPAGSYWLFATAGPGHSLARVRVDIGLGEKKSLDMKLTALPVFPSGSLSGDFHVHGGHSFDSGSMPDEDRVLAFAAANVDVIVSTDHDVVWDYADAVKSLGLADRVTVIAGAETTQMIPWLYPPDVSGPRVIGHSNFWPLKFDPTLPRNGLPTDELLEPGALLDVMRPLIGIDGVAQLNHPMANSKIFRDEGYLRMLGITLNKPLPDHDDGTAAGQLWSRPSQGGKGARNIDWDTQEAINGADLLLNMAYRAQWHSFLSQGILRAATANSDSHSLHAESLGYPRNIVLPAFTRKPLDISAFNRAVKRGEMMGTNGPFIDAVVIDKPTGSDRRGPSIVSFRPATAALLQIKVVAAPWIAIEEVRVIVNGKLVKTIAGDAIRQPVDPFGTEGILRYEGTFALAELLGGRDGWIVVEAGLPLPTTADDNNDGIPDRLGRVGDGTNITALSPAKPGEPRYYVDVIAPGTWPFAFTNPFVVDFDGNGFRAPGL